VAASVVGGAAGVGTVVVTAAEGRVDTGGCGAAVAAPIAAPPTARTAAAAPHAIGLHLWVVHRPREASGDVLLVDAGDLVTDAYPRIVEAVESGAEPGRLVSVIDLLDDEVDLTPGRHAPDAAAGTDTAAALTESRHRLAGIVGRLPALLPAVASAAQPEGPLPATSVADLARTGQLQLLGPVRAGDDPAGRPVLTCEDVISGSPAGGSPELRLSPHVDLRPGDIVVPVIAPRLQPRVITEEGALLGRGLHLLRCDPQALDPWFVAGYLRTSANERQSGTASSSGSQRFDVRRAQVPRVPVTEQRRHGAVFRQLQEFDDAVRSAAALSEQLSRHTADGLAAGVVTAED
jgi:hypothetical protein